MEYKVESSRPRGRERGLGRGCAKRCQACKLYREDAMDSDRWKKLIKDS